MSAFARISPALNVKSVGSSIHTSGNIVKDKDGKLWEEKGDKWVHQKFLAWGREIVVKTQIVFLGLLFTETTCLRAMAEASVKKARSALAVVGHGLQTIPWLSHAIVSRILTVRVESIPLTIQCVKVLIDCIVKGILSTMYTV